MFSTGYKLLVARPERHFPPFVVFTTMTHPIPAGHHADTVYHHLHPQPAGNRVRVQQGRVLFRQKKRRLSEKEAAVFLSVLLERECLLKAFGYSDPEFVFLEIQLVREAIRCRKCSHQGALGVDNIPVE